MAQKEFNEIYLEMHESIYRLAAGIVGSRTDAEDIVQELYEKLWRRRLLITSLGNPRGYILTSARNMCLDALRSRKPSTELFPATVSEDGGEYAEKDMGEVARRLIGALPERQRTAMRLRDEECMEIEEIARVMGVAGSAVRMSLSRARTTVRQQLVKIINHGL